MIQTSVAFVIAMAEEAEGVFGLASWEPLGPTPFPTFRRVAGERQAVIVISGIGTTNAAAATQYACERYAPDRVVNLGVVGCLNHDIPIGAVHAVNVCAFFDVDVTPLGFKIGQIPETEVHEYHLVAGSPTPLPGARLLSGNAFVTGRDGFHPELAGFAADFVDMELAAVAHTLLRNGILDRLESYKAPSDYCDSGSAEAFEQNMPRALAGLGEVADLILREYGLSNDEANQARG